MWCVVVCYPENLKNEEAMTRVGSQRYRKKAKCLDTQRILAPFFVRYVPDLQRVHTKESNLLEKMLYEFRDW
jgi:hypothetical protein